LKLKALEKPPRLPTGEVKAVDSPDGKINIPAFKIP